MIRVIKVGGSLFARPDFEARLAEFRQSLDEAVNLWVFGGGWLVDGIRKWCCDRRIWSQEQVHFRAIESMLINARARLGRLGCHEILLAETDVRELIPGSYVPDYVAWARGDHTLPRDWSVTSDSIAAALAAEVDADELLVLKSRFPTDSELRTGFRESDYVDSGFVSRLALIPDVRFAVFDSDLCIRSAPLRNGRVDAFSVSELD